MKAKILGLGAGVAALIEFLRTEAVLAKMGLKFSNKSNDNFEMLTNFRIE